MTPELLAQAGHLSEDTKSLKADDLAKAPTSPGCWWGKAIPQRKTAGGHMSVGTW